MTHLAHVRLEQRRNFCDCEATTKVNIAKINTKLVVARYNEPIEYLVARCVPSIYSTAGSAFDTSEAVEEIT